MTGARSSRTRRCWRRSTAGPRRGCWPSSTPRRRPGAQHPLAELGAALRDRDTLLFADCVTSLGGIPLAFSEWGVDFAYSCTQKALGAPPGMSPIACSERALERIRARDHAVPFSFDIELLLDYWVKRPITYHHTAPILHIYALYQALRHTLEEGLAARWTRHEQAGRHLQAAIRERGFDLLADPDHQLPHLTAVRVPEGIDGKRVQQRLLDEHGIEVGGGLGPDAPADVADRADGTERLDRGRRSRPGGVRHGAGKRAGAGRGPEP